jgi:hypothetical protein
MSLWYIKFLLVFFITSNINAKNLCWIVSPIDQIKETDWAFTDVEKKLTSCEKPLYINNAKCECFKCWANCKESVKSRLESSKAQQDIDQLFILNASHGDREGGTGADKVIDQKKDILSILKKSKDQINPKKLGIIFDSCYSGNLLSQSFLQDRELIKNSCIITSSTFNMTSTGGDHAFLYRLGIDGKLKEGKAYNLNNVYDFLLSDTENTPLSSALPWDHFLACNQEDNLTKTMACDTENKTFTDYKLIPFNNPELLFLLSISSPDEGDIVRIPSKDDESNEDISCQHEVNKIGLNNKSILEIRLNIERLKRMEKNLAKLKGCISMTKETFLKNTGTAVGYDALVALITKIDDPSNNAEFSYFDSLMEVKDVSDLFKAPIGKDSRDKIKKIIEDKKLIISEKHLQIKPFLKENDSDKFSEQHKALIMGGELVCLDKECNTKKIFDFRKSWAEISNKNKKFSSEIDKQRSKWCEEFSFSYSFRSKSKKIKKGKSTESTSM